MYEIFSNDTMFDMQKRTIPRRSSAIKGGCILKSKSESVIKKKKVLADLSNIIKQVNPDNRRIHQNDQKLSRQSEFDKNSNSCLENIDDSTIARQENGRLFEKVIDKKNSLLVSSPVVSDDVLNNLPTCKENIILNEISTAVLGENNRIEEDVFFGTHYSHSEDEKELISLNNCHMDAPEGMHGHCSEGGSCDESCDDGWPDNTMWKTAEEIRQIVGLSDSCRNETFTKLEDMELTSLFSEVPFAGKTTLDIPDVLFGSDSDSDREEEPPVIPVPNLEW